MQNITKQVGAIGGGVLLVVGSAMTWISVDLGFQAFSSTGLETTEGKLTLAAGIVLILLASLQLRLVNRQRILSSLAMAAATFGSVVLLLEYLDVLDRIREAEGTPATATVGMGVFIAALGALIGLVASARSIIARR